MKKYAMLMTPVSKEIIWGGDKLKKEYGKTAPFDKIAESWELTVRDGEMCVIANGEYSGKTMGEYIAEDRVGILGTNCEKYDKVHRRRRPPFHSGSSRRRIRSQARG